MLVCAAALLMKLLVPTGYMIDGGRSDFAMIPCSGTMPGVASATGMSAVQGTTAVHHGHAGKHTQPTDRDMPADHGGAEMPCAFASLSAAMLEAVDPVQLAAFIAFVLATGFAAVQSQAPPGATYLRPHLRGPPTGS